MAKAVFQHSDDDGVLSIVASGDTVILACEHGHYWILDSTQFSKDSVTDAISSRLSLDAAAEVMRRLE